MIFAIKISGWYGITTPVTMRIVHIEPDPIPTFTDFAYTCFYKRQCSCCSSNISSDVCCQGIGLFFLLQYLLLFQSDHGQYQLLLHQLLRESMPLHVLYLPVALLPLPRLL
ncbi:hypothetical protein ANAPRD1_00323 [Anaplasma phagocytophilum]|nr:hypothetical protein ANAPRD1_00323 [Anaplasma phagocytophilum]